MKRLMVLVVLVSLFCAATSYPRKGLVVNRLDGKVIVNTHITQQVKLNMWSQPRLSIKMEWDVNNRNAASVVLSFMSLHRKPSFCPKFSIFEGGVWEDIGSVEYERIASKGPVGEIVHVSINIDVLTQLALAKMPLKVRVCETEIYLHAFEYEDLREAVKIWREAR